jgi:hypothetical protein
MSPMCFPLCRHWAFQICMSVSSTHPLQSAPVECHQPISPWCISTSLKGRHARNKWRVRPQYGWHAGFISNRPPLRVASTNRPKWSGSFHPKYSLLQYLASLRAQNISFCTDFYINPTETPSSVHKLQQQQQQQHSFFPHFVLMVHCWCKRYQLRDQLVL